MANVTKVMLSSTSLDLPDYREAARDACLSAGAFPLMMEHLPAGDADALRTSLEMVDRCDGYVGIIAHRYGYVPAGSAQSITECEYERAGERGIPRLMFLIHKDTPVQFKDIETGSGAEKLARLKARIETDRVVHFFRSTDDLRAGVLHALTTMLTPHALASERAGSGSGLSISSLDGARRVSPLAGHPVLSLGTLARPVFAGGAQLSFTIAHNGVGVHSINLHAMLLEVVRYTAGRDEVLHYQIAGEEVQGAGLVQPEVFQATVAGERVAPARWMVGGRVRTARSDNFLDTDPPAIFTFPAGASDIEEIQGTVLATSPGLYELCFVFHYSVAGEDRSHRSEPLWVYSDE